MDLLIIAAIALGVVLVIVIMGIAEKEKFRRYTERKIRSEYGHLNEKGIPLLRMECIPSYYKRHGGNAGIDDITWSDLDMDRLFALMDVTYSSAGEEYLYHTLRTPLTDKDKLLERDAEIEYFRKEKEERLKLQMQFASMGKNERYSLYDYLDFADTLKKIPSLPYHFIAPILAALSVALIFIDTSVGILALVITIVINMSWYFKTMNVIQPYMTSLKYVLKDMKAAEKILALKIGICTGLQDDMKEALSELRIFKKRAATAFAESSGDGNPLTILADYTNMLLHPNIIAFYSMYSQMQKHKEEIDKLHGALGYLEMLVAAGSFKSAMSSGCVPVFDGGLEAVNIYHPLIEEPVKNSFEEKGSVLLTGSNASGKSTFLKTVAVNMLLSQTINFACADEFHTGFYRLYTSMALRDDLEQGDSYFMVEIKALRRILEAAKEEGVRIACFVDEVLRGTNTVERIAASTQILKFMERSGMLCFAATHDIELTDLLKDGYSNYHFEEEIKDGDVIFNYRLMEGKATTRNAIKLLSVMGYDADVIKEAEDMAERFIKEGVWKNG